MPGKDQTTNGAAGGSSKELVPRKKTNPSRFSKLSALVRAVRACFTPPAQYPYQPGNDDQTPQTGLIQDIQKLGFEDYNSLLQFLNAATTGINNDNTLLQEGLIQVLAKLPPTSKEGKELADGFIGQLWGTLDHPPISSLGGQYKYREADGSFNNIHMPQLGAANTPYARTAQPMVFQSPDLPDPGQIFDVLLARGGDFKGHPNGISSMLFYMATLIIHDIFQTVSDTLCLELSYLPSLGNSSADASVGLVCSHRTTSTSTRLRHTLISRPYMAATTRSKKRCEPSGMVCSNRTASARSVF
jgi:linoleate 8R-lipoxygenase/9,12-octadecadienoate 8-hydroperoxide 8R-isomerase/linoleate 8R-lipoxygenase/9,12-octadecadienoate 8-hydroperoxide 8S-isomerase